MVEKWLLQVEDVMISSLRKVIMDSNAAYSTTPRNQWVIEWPGQFEISFTLFRYEKRPINNIYISYLLLCSDMKNAQ